MNARYLIPLLLVLTALTAPAAAAQQPATLFPYPVAPDTMVQLQPRCDWLALRFWDRCNFERALRQPQRLDSAFADWLTILQHADADTARAAVHRLVERLQKTGPELAGMAAVAEGRLYSDSTATFSEELYLPFALAASKAKKVNAAGRARFALHARQIQSSGLGATLPPLELTLPDGTKKSVADIEGASVLIFINDPACDDCRMARVRLAADYNTRELLRRGELAIVSIYPEAPDDAWRADAAAYPPEWTVGALEDADEYFDLRATPAFWFLNSRHKVLARNLDIDYLLEAFRIANSRSTAAEGPRP